MTGLRRFVAAAGAPQPHRCELCAQPVPGEEHGHLVDLTDRAIVCACQACYLLFTGDGAPGRRYRAVPRRYRYTARLPISEATWDRLAVPVGLAFFFHSSQVDGPVALYPSPAGATESELDPASWRELVAAAPELTDLAVDTEALLVNRTDGADLEGFLVPIDACYHLVGLLRTRWHGFTGGPAAQQAVGEFLAELRTRAERSTPAPPGEQHRASTGRSGPPSAPAGTAGASPAGASGARAADTAGASPAAAGSVGGRR